MDLQSQLIECCKKKEKGGWKCSLASLGVHLGIVAFIVFMGMQATHKVDAGEKSIHAFLASAPAPPPPPPPPPPEPKADDGPLRVGGDVKAPSVIHRVEPKYTDPARRAHTTGVVVVEAIIDKDGNVDRVKVLKGLDFGLTEEAVEAVKQWKFRPGTLNGESVDVVFNLTVNFTLQ